MDDPFPAIFTDADAFPGGVFRQVIPRELRDAGYGHFGDLDCHDGVIWIPATSPDDDDVIARMLCYRAAGPEVLVERRGLCLGYSQTLP